MPVRLSKGRGYAGDKAGTLADLIRKPTKPEKELDRGRTKLSWMCKNNRHEDCAAMECECPCGHQV